MLGRVEADSVAHQRQVALGEEVVVVIVSDDGVSQDIGELKQEDESIIYT